VFRPCVRRCAVVLGLLLAGCRDQPADIRPASQDVTAARPATSAPWAGPGALITPTLSTTTVSSSADACRSALGVDSITFFDSNSSPSQTNYPEVNYYWIAVVPGPCPPTHVDITVTGYALVGGVRAQVRVASPDKVELRAAPLPKDPEHAGWGPEVKRGQLLGTVTLRNGRAAQLVLPKLSGPNNGLPVYHPETPLLPNDEP
jgi:hypothetical protein